ncbi:MAG: lipoate--protein ligase family protein [Planctomycetes bacterium]|nr:lipoate--protein ligase family protein [Planctomycetota bacterium]
MRQSTASAADSPGTAAIRPGETLPWPAAGSPTASRWLVTPAATVEEQLALDEALLEAAHDGRLAVPMVRTWMAGEPTVVVGSSSRIDEEVDREACAAVRARIVRRPSGGLTVVLGPGCVMWSVVAPLPTDAPPSIDRLHAALLDPLAAALLMAGRPVRRRGTSDLALATGGNERKVSGNALRVRRAAVLYHGTLLDAFDIGLVGRLLRHPPREPAYRAGRDHASFLANLSLGQVAVDHAVRTAFAASTACTDWPVKRVAELVRERYAAPAWNERFA